MGCFFFEMVKKMKISQGAINSNKRKASKKQRRSRKPKFELGKPKKRYENKKKDKKRKRKEIIAKLGLEEFPLMFARIRASNQRSREFNSEINARILNQLKAWDEEDQGF